MKALMSPGTRSLVTALFILASGAVVLTQETTVSSSLTPEITVTGDSGTAQQLEWVDALPSSGGWSPLTNVVLVDTKLRLLDLNAPLGSSRFYRAVNHHIPSDPEPAGRPQGFVWIQPGSFTMGSPMTEPDRDGDEGPQTQVAITSGFWMGRHEVTQREYVAIMGANPSHFKGETLPVDLVGWGEATHYCARLTEREATAGRLPPQSAYRLPTEAEWEYACRAGTKTAFAFGSGLSSAQANYGGTYPNNGSTVPVESYAPNAWGLYDMHGNAWELCSDFYGLYPGGSVTDPKGPTAGSYRVIRGGCWADGAWFCRSAYRFSFGPGVWYGSIGFRVVLAKVPTPFAKTGISNLNTRLSVALVSTLTVNARPGTHVQIEWADPLGNTNRWRPLTNLMVEAVSQMVVDREVPIGGRRIYRARSVSAEPVDRPPKLLWIPAGTFVMGTPDSEVDRGWEGPQTEVTLTQGFWMGQHEVTQKEYEAVQGPHKSNWTGDNLPVETVTWHDAVDYCSQLTELERTAGRLPLNHHYRLPTEAEWEYACRGGTATRFSYGDDPGYALLRDYGWFTDNAESQTHPVASKLPNPWGLFDMHGNVWEWCHDWYGSFPGGKATDPQNLEQSFVGNFRTVRGGCVANSGGGCRSANRNGFPPDHSYYGIGFRVVLARVP